MSKNFAHQYDYPEDLPENLYKLWDAGSEIHEGDEEKFRWWIKRMFDYLGYKSRYELN